jgi:hypothetical protein
MMFAEHVTKSSSATWLTVKAKALLQSTSSHIILHGRLLSVWAEEVCVGGVDSVHLAIMCWHMRARRCWERASMRPAAALRMSWTTQRPCASSSPVSWSRRRRSRNCTAERCAPLPACTPCLALSQWLTAQENWHGSGASACVFVHCVPDTQSWEVWTFVGARLLVVSLQKALFCAMSGA